MEFVLFLVAVVWFAWRERKPPRVQHASDCWWAKQWRIPMEP